MVSKNSDDTGRMRTVSASASLYRFDLNVQGAVEMLAAMKKINL